jgi:hypothetical protein
MNDASYMWSSGRNLLPRSLAALHVTRSDNVGIGDHESAPTPVAWLSVYRRDASSRHSKTQYTDHDLCDNCAAGRYCAKWYSAGVSCGWLSGSSEKCYYPSQSIRAESLSACHYDRTEKWSLFCRLHIPAAISAVSTVLVITLGLILLHSASPRVLQLKHFGLTGLITNRHLQNPHEYTGRSRVSSIFGRVLPQDHHVPLQSSTGIPDKSQMCAYDSILFFILLNDGSQITSHSEKRPPHDIAPLIGCIDPQQRSNIWIFCTKYALQTNVDMCSSELYAQMQTAKSPRSSCQLRTRPFSWWLHFIMHQRWVYKTYYNDQFT